MARAVPLHSDSFGASCGFPLVFLTARPTCHSNVKKHVSEIDKMTDPEHLRLIPLVEAALALMRLSCEKFFVLVSVYVSYLLFRDPPGEAMRFMIRLNARYATARCSDNKNSQKHVTHRLSMYIQKTILYCFPAICWVYNAGFIFSSFVSFVFWGGAIMRAYESVRRSTTVVRPSQLRVRRRKDLLISLLWAAFAFSSWLAASLPCRHRMQRGTMWTAWVAIVQFAGATWQRMGAALSVASRSPVGTRFMRRAWFNGCTSVMGMQHCKQYHNGFTTVLNQARTYAYVSNVPG